jgi:ABC-type phosphonate transport system ATPase subunit
MRYRSFRIQNFKGIKDTTVSLEGIGGASIFAFVGLNESGKTTVLEAIHSFSPDPATSELIGGDEGSGVPFKERVPRHLISSFTGDVSVIAVLSVSDTDKEAISLELEKQGLVADLANFPRELVFERQQLFRGGDFVESYFTLRTEIKIRGKKQKRWRSHNSGEESKSVRDAIYKFAPSISYFPTFVFDFPERIFLTNRGGVVDRFYRKVFQDILDFDRRGHTIEQDIVRRVRSQKLVIPWLNFLTFWQENDDKDKIQHVMDRASATVTELVFGRWNKIFGEDTRGKEITITAEVAEGEKLEENGAKTKTNEHDVFIKFQIKDGTRRFNVNDRSLGFRWFFAFMLFTQFRVARSRTQPLLFLFDEPASNLHAAAQQKLIDSFPEIARDEHTLGYTTHSHYMIEPKWLEQTFIVTNRADDPSDSVLDGAALDDESLDIKVETYRSFVNKHPSQTNYFQPILDRLEVVPSRFDMQKASIILEGKSDYYVLRYAAKLVGLKDLPLLPGLGAGTFSALAALHVGWNLNFLFVLDGDKQGHVERERYSNEYGIPSDRLVVMSELVMGVKVIEDLLDENALKLIQAELKSSKTPSKSQIRRFFQERLASDQVADLGPFFRETASALLEKLKAALFGK